MSLGPQIIVSTNEEITTLTQCNESTLNNIENKLTTVHISDLTPTRKKNKLGKFAIFQ